MRFYTFAKLYGDSILVRGYDDAKGGSFKDKVSFKPTLFLPSPKPTGYKTLDGRNVAPVQPGNPRDCRNFIEDYASVDGTAVYGFERYLYQYLSQDMTMRLSMTSTRLNCGHWTSRQRLRTGSLNLTWQRKRSC